MVASTNTLDWSIELIASDRDSDYMVTISRDQAESVGISGVKLDAREDVAAAVLEVRFPSIEHFYDAWEETNPFAIGAMIRLRVEGIARFTGTITNFQPVYSANDRSCVVTAHDKMWATKDAIVEINKKRRVIREKVNLTRKAPGSYIWVSADGTYPWAKDYLIPVWIKDPNAGKAYRVQYSEYQILYTLGGIYFNYSEVKVLGSDNTVDPDGDGEVRLDDPLGYEDEIYAEIAYYDSTDTSTMVSELLTDVFTYTSTDGGLGWTDGVDFILEDTPQDILNKLEWHTKQGDGDIQTLISTLYDNADYQFPINYWIRDFDGAGIVEGRYVYQQSGLVFNGDCSLDPASYPAGNWYCVDWDNWTYDGGDTRFN
jgi:hypothetical protein